MTLIVALADSSVAAIIADRRISHGQSVLDDEYNKVTVLFCADARLAVAFTGLATHGSFDTSTWIAETLHAIGETIRDIHSVLEEFRRRAGARFSTFLEDDRRLTIVFCGFVYWTESPEPRVFVLSNFEHGGSASSSFTLRTSGGPNSTLLELAGTSAHVSERTTERLRSLLNANVPPSSLVRFAVRHLQNAAKDERSLRRIGEQCNAAVIHSAIDTPVTNTYHTAKNANRAYGPNVVVLGSLVCLGSEVMAPSILAGPEIRKQDPCWCDSGLTFKRCHMRKYGAVYLNHPAWNRPLVSMIRCTSDQGWSAGMHFCVQGGYA